MSPSSVLRAFYSLKHVSTEAFVLRESGVSCLYWPQDEGKQKTLASENPVDAPEQSLNQTNHVGEPDNSPIVQTQKAEHASIAFAEDFWEIAFRSLDQNEQSRLRSVHDGPDDTSLAAVLQGTVHVVETQFQIRKLRDDEHRIRRAAKCTLNSAISVRDAISGIVAADPTGHASAAWMAQNDIALQNALFESAEVLSAILARYTVVEKLSRASHADTSKGMEGSIIHLWIVFDNSAFGERIWTSVSVPDLASHRLLLLRTSIEKEDQAINSWVNLDQNIQKAYQAFQISKLPVAAEAIYGSFERRYEELCFEGTRIEKLEKIVSWVDDPEGEQFFWLNGMAGTEKSTISRSLAKLFTARGILGASFFFDGRRTECVSPKQLVPTILYQLTTLLPTLKVEIQAVLEKDSILFTKTLREQIDCVLVELLKKLPVDQRQILIFIIDAMDQCRDKRDTKQLLRNLVRVRGVGALDLRFFITRRPEPKPEEKTIKELAQRASPLFIVVSTICLFIDDERFSPVERTSVILQHRHFGDQLVETYQTILEQMIIDTRDVDRQQILTEFWYIVGSVITLYDPLPATSLALLLDMEEDDVHLRLKFLRSVLIIPDGNEADAPIEPLQQSFPDFLGKQCLRVMSDKKIGLRRNICNLENDGILQSEISDVTGSISPVLKYACRYWSKHLLDGDEPSDQGDMYSFFQEHLLQWLEVMSILGLTSEVLTQLRSTQNLIDKTRETPLARLLPDAVQFVRRAMEPISLSPLQVYSSAIMFTPQISLIRKMFESKVPNDFAVLPQSEMNRGAQLQTSQGPYPVRPLAFGPDDCLLAFSCERTSAKLWNTEGTGSQRVQTYFDCPDLWVETSTLSPDGRLVACAMFDGEVQIWRVFDSEKPMVRLPRSGIHYRGEFDTDFPSCGPTIRVMGFSCNSQMVATATFFREIKVWDLTKPGGPPMLNVVEQATVEAIGFTNNDQQLMWSIGTHIKICNKGDDGSYSRSAIIPIWKGKSDEGLMVFAPLSKRVAYSAQKGQVIKLLNLDTITMNQGVVIRRLRPHLTTFDGLQLSRDDRWLAAWNGIVQVWDLERIDLFLARIGNSHPSPSDERCAFPGWTEAGLQFQREGDPPLAGGEQRRGYHAGHVAD
ncbi:WD40 repeat domain-containing protein [Aspergillus brunneoviolaceus CBS 621.78]|uniref:Uncharacterized protein n=1 Tax=Aspergillus brunneoviolaceus CBS 621.78 TaxID=1450534 RepID=A0ACD1GBU7_9EURO|nr:hypothetical protein BO95DRAFT_481503 [Aspergillus brunneoviolaceus CBS 621.78]RAH46751.1 hypothetical protein BO95DRAFT_481503 [Aspergillus brunneoviolaceus CBS 621.78]